MSDPVPPPSTDNAPVAAAAVSVGRVQEQLDAVARRLDGLEQAVTALGRNLLERPGPDGVREQIGELRDELLMRQAAFAGALRDAVEESSAAETTRRTAEEAEFRKDQQRAQQVMASAVLEALDATAAADASAREAMRTEVVEMVASVRAGLVAEVATATATVAASETEQVRTVLHSAVQRMVEAQKAAVRDELRDLMASFEHQLHQMADAFQLESAVVAGLRAEIRDTGARHADATVAIVRDQVLELRAGLQAVEEVSTRTADWLRADRSEGATELRSSIVGVAQANFDRVTEMVATSLEAARAATTGEVDRLAKLMTDGDSSIRAELTKLQRDGEVARAGTGDQVAALVEGLTAELHAEVSKLRASLGGALAELASGDVAAMAELRSDLRAVIERTTGDTVAAMRSDVASIRAALSSVELAGTAAADGVAALRAESGPHLRDGIRGDLEALVAQLGLGLTATIERTDDRSLEALREAMGTVRLGLEEALRNEGRRRDETLRSVQEELVGSLTSTMGEIGPAVTAGVDATAAAAKEHLDTLRVEVEASLIALRTTLRDSLAKDKTPDLAARLGRELGATLESLEQALADTLQTDSDSHAQQQRVLRDELADALAAVAQLVVDTARGEAHARSSAFEATGQRIDQLARAISAVVTAQADLRAAFLQRFGQ